MSAADVDAIVISIVVVIVESRLASKLSDEVTRVSDVFIYSYLTEVISIYGN